MQRSILEAALAGLAVATLTSCGGGSGGGTPPADPPPASTTLFADDFDAAAEEGSEPWAGGATLPNGWTSRLPGEQCWWVTTAGGDGGAADHALVADNNDDLLLHAVPEQDYTVTAQVLYTAKIPLDNGDYDAGLVARFEDATSYYYACRLYTDHVSGATWLELAKVRGALVNSSRVKLTDGSMTFTYYRLSLSVDGDEITASAESPKLERKSVTLVDDISSYGPALVGTRAGIFFDAAADSFHPYFDDFAITRP